MPSSEFWALRGISFKIDQGERVGIVGGNGAGKSTLLRLLARIYPPTSGQVAIRGNVAPLIEMGAGFNPELCGTDNILLNGAMLGFSRRQMQAQGRADLRVHRPARVRRAAPEVLLQRHVHAARLRDRDRDRARDPPDRRIAGRRRRRLHRQGQGPPSRAVRALEGGGPRFSRHGILRELCTRGLWLEHGQLVADGPIDEIIDRYLESVARRPLRLVRCGSSSIGLILVLEGRSAHGIDRRRSSFGPIATGPAPSVVGQGSDPPCRWHS